MESSLLLVGVCFGGELELIVDRRSLIFVQ